MILEHMPEARGLSSHEKRQLAEELLIAADEEEGVTVDPAIIALLDQRLAEYEANPDEVSSWEDVSARVFRQR